MPLEPSPDRGRATDQSFLHVPHLRIGVKHRSLYLSMTTSSVSRPTTLKLYILGIYFLILAFGSETTSSWPLDSIVIVNSAVGVNKVGGSLDVFYLGEYIIPITIIRCPGSFPSNRFPEAQPYVIRNSIHANLPMNHWVHTNNLMPDSVRLGHQRQGTSSCHHFALMQPDKPWVGPNHWERDTITRGSKAALGHELQGLSANQKSTSFSKQLRHSSCHNSLGIIITWVPSYVPLWRDMASCFIASNTARCEH